MLTSLPRVAARWLDSSTRVWIRRSLLCARRASPTRARFRPRRFASHTINASSSAAWNHRSAPSLLVAERFVRPHPETMPRRRRQRPTTLGRPSHTFQHRRIRALSLSASHARRDCFLSRTCARGRRASCGTTMSQLCIGRTTEPPPSTPSTGAVHPSRRRRTRRDATRAIDGADGSCARTPRRTGALALRSVVDRAAARLGSAARSRGGPQLEDRRRAAAAGGSATT